MLAYFELDLKLDDLKYTEFNKPYFNQHFTFSIAHSGDLVVCAGDLDTEIGIDIEQIVPMELIDYKDQLTIDEWNFIHQSIDKQRTFYDIWTKKEALLKAIGRGMDVELNTLDVYADTARYEGKNYWFYPLEIAEDHIAYLATSAPSDSVSISSERLSDLL
jgi:4'-phosphopantetheinyl transferase